MEGKCENANCLYWGGCGNGNRIYKSVRVLANELAIKFYRNSYKFFSLASLLEEAKNLTEFVHAEQRKNNFRECFSPPPSTIFRDKF